MRLSSHLFGYWCVAIAATIALACPALGQSDLIPLAKGNRWSLKAFLKPDAISISVDAVHVYGPKAIGYLKTEHPKLGTTISLISVANDGIYLEGYIEDGITHLFAESWPYFLTGRSVRSSWTNPYGKVELMDNHLTTTSATGITYRDCYEYKLTLADGGVFTWVLKPGIGFIRFGEGAGAFTLRSYAVGAKEDVGGNAQSEPCPRVGLSSIPRGPEITQEMREAAFKEAVTAGASFLKVEASWDELEPQPGVYVFDRIRSELALTSAYDLPVVLTVKTVDTTIRSLPFDIRDQPLDSDVVLARWDALLNHLREVLTPQVKWINLGYELDFYLLFHPEDIGPFVMMYQYGAAKLKAAGDYSIGLIFQYDNSRISDVVFRALSGLCDHVAVNYYGHTEGFKMRDPKVPLVDIPFLISSVPGNKPILITELGYASSEVIGGSPEKQAQFIQNAFQAVALSAGRIKVVNVWAIRDLPRSYIQSLVERYQLDNPEFVAFLGSLGLQTEDGVSKPAWDVFRDTTSQFAKPGTCSAPQ